MIPLLPLVSNALGLARELVRLVPTRDPEIARLRVEQRAALRRLREEHRHEERMARLARPG